MSEAAEFYAEAGVCPDCGSSPFHSRECIRRVLVENAECEAKKSAHGLTMYGFNVLVEPDEVPDKIGSFYIPDSKRDQLAYSVTEGVLVALSTAAFSYHDWPEGTRLPQVGDKVKFGKFVGGEAIGNDGIKYRVMEDKEILAVRS